MGRAEGPRAPRTARPSVSRATAASTCRWMTLALIYVKCTAVESTATVTRGNATAKMGTRALTVATLQTPAPPRTVASTGDASAATASALIFTLERSARSHQEVPAVSWLCMVANSLEDGVRWRLRTLVRVWACSYVSVMNLFIGWTEYQGR